MSVVIKSVNIYNSECVVSLMEEKCFYLRTFPTEPSLQASKLLQTMWILLPPLQACQSNQLILAVVFIPPNRSGILNATVFTPLPASLTWGGAACVFVSSSLEQRGSLAPRSHLPPACVRRAVLALQLLLSSTLPVIKTLNIPIQQPPLMSSGSVPYLTVVKKWRHIQLTLIRGPLSRHLSALLL